MTAAAWMELLQTPMLASTGLTQLNGLQWKQKIRAEVVNDLALIARRKEPEDSEERVELWLRCLNNTCKDE